MHKHVLVCFIFYSFFLKESCAHQPQEGQIHATLGPYTYSTLTESNRQLPKSTQRTGAMLLIEGGVDKNGGVELSLSYLNKMYYKEQSGLYLHEEIKRLQIGLGYRHWFNNKISFASHFSSAYSMGDVDVVHTDFPEKATSAHDVTEYGFDFSLLYEVWRYKRATITIDLQYFASTSSGGDENADVFGGLIGYKYLIQKNKSLKK